MTIKEQSVGKIVIITSVLATFVLYLCAGVSKFIPFFFVAALIIVLAAPHIIRCRAYTSIKLYTQKAE